MHNCTNKCISIVTLILAVMIFIQTNFLTLMLFSLSGNGIKFTKEQQIIGTQDAVNASIQEETEEWKLVIPQIDVSSTIKEGTTQEIINNNIGHFTETPTEKGNIGLIAASAGYEENYFARLAELKEGDAIIYIKGELKKEYKVVTNTVISEQDWSYLKNTEDNRITLITGILEQPESRRCVQAVEI